jgi:ankyrin repeat protein
MLHLAMTTLLDPSPEIVQLLIAAGVDPNARDNDGKTPLGLAIEKREETSDEEAKKKWDAIIDILQSHAT